MDRNRIPKHSFIQKCLYSQQVIDIRLSRRISLGKIICSFYYVPFSLKKKRFDLIRFSQDTPAGTLQRKKSLPDVKCLDVTTQAQGSKAMTREEISVLSSARREAVRRQLEEIEAYKNNPFLYILNPRVKVRRSGNTFSRFVVMGQ